MSANQDTSAHPLMIIFLLLAAERGEALGAYEVVMLRL